MKKELAYYVVGMWKGLIEAEWVKDDLIDLGKALFSKRTLRSLIEGGKKDQAIFQMIQRNFEKAAGIMINYVEEQKVKEAKPVAPIPTEEAKVE